jgi:hypothetical protein
MCAYVCTFIYIHLFTDEHVCPCNVNILGHNSVNEMLTTSKWRGFRKGPPPHLRARACARVCVCGQFVINLRINKILEGSCETPNISHINYSEYGLQGFDAM